MSGAPDSARSFGTGGRFVAGRRLGAGGFGVVWECFDRERVERVALKVLSRGQGDALLRFKSEFRALGDIHHPNLVRLYELFADGDDWFFTMELIDGVDFVSFARPVAAPSRSRVVLEPFDDDPISAPSTTVVLPPSLFPDSAPVRVANRNAARSAVAYDSLRLKSALLQLAEAIAALHAVGTLHRDLKPRNVLVNVSGEQAGRVVVLDFGLASDIAWPADASNSLLLGTPAYMAPELTDGGRASTASDWYSFGVMLYESLVGIPPHHGTPSELMEAKRRFDPEPPSARVEGVDGELEALCMALLQRDPTSRPAGEDVIARLGGAPRRARAVMSVPPPSVPFVGRKSELAELEDAAAHARRGNSVAVVVRGRTGMGKTTLVRSFREKIAVAREPAIVLSGRCFPRESVPFKALDSFIDALARQLMHLPREVSLAPAPRDAAALIRLFPVLDASMPADIDRSDAAIDAREVRAGAAHALRAMLREASRSALVVICLDDLQWDDADSASLLLDVFRPEVAPPVLLIATVRAEDAPRSHVVGALQGLAKLGLPLRGVELSTLSADEARTLAALHLGPTRAAQSITETIVEESRGDPFLLGEIAEHMRGRDGADDDSVEWAVGDAPADAPRRRDSMPPARWLDTLMLARIERLSESARRLLEMLAVAGAPLPRSLAQHAAQLDHGEQLALLALSAGSFLRVIRSGAGDFLDVYHERVREVVLAAMDAASRRSRHARLARALEAASGDPESIGRHFLAAGEPERAVGFLSEAADRAARALAFDRSIALYCDVLEARRASGREDSAETANVQRALGEAHQNAGRGVEAAKAYEAAASATGDGVAAIDLRRRAAEQLMSAGRFDEGVDRMHAVFVDLGLTWPSSPVLALGGILVSRAALATLGEREPDPGVQLPARDRARIDALWSSATTLGMLDLLFGGELTLRLLRMSLASREPHCSARALALAALVATTEGVSGEARSRQWLERSRAALTLEPRPENDALAAIASGYQQAMEGHWRAAAVEADLALELLRARCVGQRWSESTALLLSLLCQRVMGEMHAIERMLSSRLGEAIALGDVVTEVLLRIDVAAHLFMVKDRVDEARAELAAIARWPRPKLSGAEISLADAHHFGESFLLDVYEFDTARARGRLHERWRGFERSAWSRLATSRLTLSFYRGCLAVERAIEPGGRQEGLAMLEQCARVLDSLGTATSVALAGTLRGSRAAIEGRDEAASWALGRAEDAFVSLEMGCHAEVLRRARGLLEGGERGRARMRAAESALRTRGVRNVVAMSRTYGMAWMERR